MATDYRPQLGAARRPIPPRRGRRPQTDRHRRNQWDIRAISWTLASILLVLALLVLSRLLLRIWSLSAR